MKNLILIYIFHVELIEKLKILSNMGFILEFVIVNNNKNIPKFSINKVEAAICYISILLA